MRLLSTEEIDVIHGQGVSNSEANQVIGKAIGEAWHGLTSVEARIGAVFGVPGMVAGAVLHYKLRH